MNKMKKANTDKKKIKREGNREAKTVLTQPHLSFWLDDAEELGKRMEGRNVEDKALKINRMRE